MDAHRDRILILTGPTAAGKTKLSLRLAQALDGEIISADSMQVYRGMDIGTDKIRQEEMQGIPHHLIDILDPAEEFNVYTFQKLADEKIRKQMVGAELVKTIVVKNRIINLILKKSN